MHKFTDLSMYYFAIEDETYFGALAVIYVKTMLETLVLIRILDLMLYLEKK
ncbi:hypothetical protein SAMN03159341_12521 [Paenibacillus sp. 1_12]|nr:hypothetical protein SAMN03159341_12521 [Paenibacillus sp. 1_12]